MIFILKAEVNAKSVTLILNPNLTLTGSKVHINDQSQFGWCTVIMDRLKTIRVEMLETESDNFHHSNNNNNAEMLSSI